MRPDDGEHWELFNATQGLRQGSVLSPLLFNVSFAAAVHAVLVRSSEDPDILRDFVHFDDDFEGGGVGVHTYPLACGRRPVWGMLNADDASRMSKSAEDLVRMMTVIVAVFEAKGVMPKKKTHTMHRAPDDVRQGPQ